MEDIPINLENEPSPFFNVLVTPFVLKAWLTKQKRRIQLGLDDLSTL